jgi:intein/homing endonuclease
MTKNEILLKIQELEHEATLMKNYEQAVKITLNSIYGAFGNPYFYFFNVAIAESITIQGKDAILYTEKVLNSYFTKFWHKDKAAHEKIGVKNVKPVKQPVCIYCDTDSIIGDSLIRVNGTEITIKDLWNILSKHNGFHLSQKGDEIVKCDGTSKVLNFSLEKGIYEVPIKKVIRHKVKKAKWKLKTKSGKEIICTGDHSLMVLRNNKLIKVKPNEILKTDKVVSILKK